MTRDLPSPELLRKLLRYDPETGKLFWVARNAEFFTNTNRRSASHAQTQWNERYADQEAFTAFDGHGYLMGRIFKKPYKAHRVAWAIVNGEWPNGQIDHLNGNRSDNRLKNLRQVDQSENNKNSKKRSNNKSGVTGVCFDKERQKWMVTICGKFGGRFQNFEDAVAHRLILQNSDNFTERHGK